MTTTYNEEILERLLKIDHQYIAKKLELIDECPETIDEELLIKSVNLIDKLSRVDSEESKNKAIMMASLLWAHWDNNWQGVTESLVLSLSRMGFAPSAFMVDKGYDNVKRKYSPMLSLLSELYTTIYQLNTEVEVGEKTYLLTAYQKRIWDGINTNRILGVSAPTSAGKSFLLQLKTIEMLLEKRGSVLYIVPNLSLVSQVSTSYRMLLDNHRISDVPIYNTRLNYDDDIPSINILTQEKALSSISFEKSFYKNLRILIVDEIQNIEKVADESDHRAKILYDFIIEFTDNHNPDKVVICGPRIQDIGLLGKQLFSSDIEQETTLSSPVSSLTYSIEKGQRKFYFNQYCSAIPSNNKKQLDVKNKDMLTYYNKKSNSNDYIEFLVYILEGLGDDHMNIIFSQTSTAARKLAEGVTFKISGQQSSELDSLRKYLQKTVRENYTLCNCLLKGIAYHHGKLPMHVRMVVEEAFSQKVIKTVCCTTTLMQGVNLPAQNIIVKTPNLFTKARSDTKGAKLTSYEFANLRGRAGRLNQDLLGRCFVLNEGSFMDDENEEMNNIVFEEKTKKLNAGYGEVFSANREDIIDNVTEPSYTLEEQEEGLQFLAIHIRQTILKYGDQAIEKLGRVGIELSQKEFRKIFNILSRLSVSREVCMKNRYWDPFELDNIHNNIKDMQLLVNHNDNDAVTKIKVMLEYFINNHLSKFNKYLFRTTGFAENSLSGRLMQVVILSSKWMKEEPLSSILAGSYYEDSEQIDKTLALLENKVKYGIPALLKPLYDIRNDDSNTLRCFETGAYLPLTRRLIEMSIPRETAIRINHDFMTRTDENLTDSELRKKIMKITSELDKWEVYQLAPVIGKKT